MLPLHVLTRSLLLVLSFAPRGFSPGTPVFPSPQKPTFPNSNSTRNQVDEEPLNVDELPPNHYSFIYFIILFILLTLDWLNNVHIRLRGICGFCFLYLL